MKFKRKFVSTAVGISRFCALTPRAITRVTLAALVLAALSLSVVNAQVNTGTLSGEVTEVSGAVVSGATVTVQDASTGYKRTVTTAGDGNYAFSNLSIGTYEVAVSASGFSTAKEAVTINVGFRSRGRRCAW